jgi:hypothetical protein
MGAPKRYRVILLVESNATNTQVIKDDIHKALAPLGFFPHVVKVEDHD